MTYAELLFQLKLAGIFGVIAALFAVLFDYSLYDGNILDKYYDLIQKINNKYLFSWLGGCTICFSFTFITLPIWVYKYLNFQLNGFWNNILLLFVQYSITFVLLYVYFWAEEIVKLHKKKLEYDIQRADLLQRRMSGGDKGDKTHTTAVNTNLKSETSRTGNQTSEEVIKNTFTH